jgi:hypothetical protein
MNKRLTSIALLVALAAVVMTLFAAPSFATEGGGEAPAGEEDNGKIGLPQTEHDQVGLILLGITGLFVVAAGANAVKQYRGTRPQADGRIRWR